ncbi:MAG: ABC transporter ATP-binding protein [Muribaculaceae bacterium]|nr:ABC transporter ATP-binding protein [Muribaculaceae bacterium]
MSILITDGLHVGYRHNKKQVTLLGPLNLRLSAGRLAVLIGQNGAGKSTLIRTLTCALPPVAGRVLVAGENVREQSQRERSRLIALVSTERIQAGGLTVTELVSLGRQPHTDFLGRLSDEDHQIVMEAMSDVGIMHKAESYVASLSDGERQKAMIARALAQQTPIIILDEPTAFLDVASRIETMQLLAKLAHEGGKAVLLSTHDLAQSLRQADDLWLITRDREVVTGATADVIHTAAMNDLFTTPHIAFNPTILDYQWRD